MSRHNDLMNTILDIVGAPPIHDGPAPCPRCGAHKGYAVSRTVEIGGESDERRDQIMMQCNGCGAAFEVEDVEPRVLN